MRFSGLICASALGLLLAPLSCGDDSSGGVAAGASAGEPAGGGDTSPGTGGDGMGASTAQGGKSTGTAGKNPGGGSTQVGLGGDEALAGGDAAEGGGPGAGGGDGGGPLCQPKDQVPEPVTTSLEVQPTCTATTACAGDIEDTAWAYSDVCLDQDVIFAPVYKSCATSHLNGPADIVVKGSLTFANGVATHEATISTTGVFQIPSECASCDCKGEQTVLKNAGAGPNTYCYPECYPDFSCRCLIDFETNVSQSEAYTLTGGALTLKSGKKYDVCKSDAGLSMTEKGASPLVAGTAKLIPAADTVTPEICDGIDNDKNGKIDDDPVDCPPTPCDNLGVCKGVKPTCNTFWSCDYTAVKRETGDEKTCDGLDNDCDGEVDEKLVGCFEICDGLDNDNDGTPDDDAAGSPCNASLGVCKTGSTSTCLGKGGWRCDEASASFEAQESSCDGLDNDCDGQVDEGCGCATGTSKMYVVHWGQTPELVRANLDGTNVEPIAPLSVAALTKVAVDSKNNRLYFGDGAKIQSADLDGKNIKTEWTGQAQTWDVNPANGLLLGECNTSNVCKLNPPSTYGTLFQPASVAGLDIDPVNRWLYWTDYGQGANYWIRRIGFDGTGQMDIVKDAQAALSIKVDPAGQRIYWPNAYGIYQAHLDGTNEVLWYPMTGVYVYSMAIDHNGGKLYYSDVNAKQVRRVGLDAKNDELLIKDIDYAVSISLYLCP
ncbi:MAG TPA: MopE-related protein [Polyangiaceae bacterium]|nr:MopE-related protein [Polyangiaceae bacterium]